MTLTSMSRLGEGGREGGRRERERREGERREGEERGREERGGGRGERGREEREGGREYGITYSFLLYFSLT